MTEKELMNEIEWESESLTIKQKEIAEIKDKIRNKIYNYINLEYDNKLEGDALLKVTAKINKLKFLTKELQLAYSTKKALALNLYELDNKIENIIAKIARVEYKLNKDYEIDKVFENADENFDFESLDY